MSSSEYDDVLRASQVVGGMHLSDTPQEASVEWFSVPLVTQVALSLLYT